MKQCKNCESLQEKGNFCAKCGGETVDVAAINAESPNQNESPVSKGDQPTNNEAPAQTFSDAAAVSNQEEAATTAQQPNSTATSGIDVKEVSTEYWNYFLRLIKNPTLAFDTTEREFTNSLINIVLYAITFAISIYFTISALDTLAMGGLSYVLGDGDSIKFFPIFFRIGLMAIIALACTLVCILAIEKMFVKQMFVKQMSAKQQIVQYGGLITPFIAVNMLALLAGLAGSFGVAFSLSALSLFISTIIYGVIFVYEKVSVYRTTPHKVYATIGVFLANMLLIYVLLRIFLLQKLGELQEILSYI